MPLIRITSKPRYYPPEDGSEGTSDQRKTALLGEGMPATFMANVDFLHMDLDTPEKGIQVSHRPAHVRDVNAPDIWVLIEFSEDDLTDVQQVEAAGRVQQLLLYMFATLGYQERMDFACDVRWSPSHGFLSIGGEKLDW